FLRQVRVNRAEPQRRCMGRWGYKGAFFPVLVSYPRTRPALRQSQDVVCIHQGKGERIVLQALVPTLRVGTGCRDALRRGQGTCKDFLTPPGLRSGTRSVPGRPFPRGAWERGKVSFPRSAWERAAATLCVADREPARTSLFLPGSGPERGA